MTQNNNNNDNNSTNNINNINNNNIKIEDNENNNEINNITVEENNKNIASDTNNVVSKTENEVLTNNTTIDKNDPINSIIIQYNDNPNDLVEWAKSYKAFEAGRKQAQQRIDSLWEERIESLIQKYLNKHNNNNNHNDNSELESTSEEDLNEIIITSSDESDTNPLSQFDIRELLSLNLLDTINISLTNIGLYLILASFVILILYLISNNYNKITSNNWSAGQESLYATIHSIVINQINEKKGQMYFPFIFTLFIFILCNNLIGMIPYSFASTSHFVFTFSLSFTIVLGATILGFIIHKLKLFSLFVPSGCPLPLLALLVLIEFISYLARNVSLGLRLAANILSGHMLLNILSGFTYNIMNSGFLFFFLALLPLAFIIAFSGLELGIAFIQAQVFVVLSCSYIKDGLELH